MKKQFFTIFLFFVSAITMFSQPLLRTRYEEVEFKNSTGDEVKDKWFAEVTTQWDKTNSKFWVVFKQQLRDTAIIRNTLTLEQISQWEKKQIENSPTLYYCLTQSSMSEKYLMLVTPSSPTTSEFVLILKYENQKNGFALSNFSGETRETIMHINQDAQSAFMHVVSSYKTLASNSKLSLARDFENDSLKISYTSEYVRLKESENFLEVTFPLPNNHNSIMVKRNINRNLTFDKGVYTYKNDSIFTKDNRYGLSTGSEKGFKNFRYSWIVPDNIEIVSHRCNRKGIWTRQTNSIIFTGENINNILFEISFKIKNLPSKEIEKTQVNLKETMKVPNGKVSISIWDNNVEDGDMISLSLNGIWIVRNLVVSKCKTIFELNLEQKDNFLIMKAENVGSRPPNTASFLVESQGFKKEVVLNSDLGKSEMINIQLE